MLCEGVAGLRPATPSHNTDYIVLASAAARLTPLALGWRTSPPTPGVVLDIREGQLSKTWAGSPCQNRPFSARALSFFEGRQWEARPSQSEVVAGEGTSHGSGRSPRTASNPRPTVSPDEILSKARSRVSKLVDPALAGLQEALLKAKNQAKVPSLEDQVCVNRALHHPREEESRRCRSQSGRCHRGPRQVAQGIGGWREVSCTVARTI